MHAGHDRIEGDRQQPVVAHGLKDQCEQKKQAQEDDFAFTDGQNVAIKELLHVPGHAAGAADHSQAEGHYRRKNDADGCIRRKIAFAAHGHDRQAHQNAKKRHGKTRIHGQHQAQGHPRKGRVPDGVGKEGHAEVDDLHAQHGGHGREQEQGQQSLLHETRLEAVQRQQAEKRVERGEIRHAFFPGQCSPAERLRACATSTPGSAGA